MKPSAKAAPTSNDVTDLVTENEIQRDILLTMGCDELQGFLYSRALPASQLFDWLAVRAAA